MIENINEHIKSYYNKGTIVVKKNCITNPLTEDDIQKLDLCCKEVEKEYVSIGDAGEKNNLLVVSTYIFI